MSIDTFKNITPDLAAIEQLYAEAFAYYSPERSLPKINISLYPYIGINHTIRVRSGDIFVRISELCREMPHDAHRGLAYILVGKLLRKRIPHPIRQVYEIYSHSDELRLAAESSKRSRGRKVITTDIGEVYDLGSIFDELNARYFGREIERPTLSWSAKRTFRILGHHDRTHGHISISRSLDDQRVPKFVVEYVMFHEMLHIVHPARIVNGRRYNHTSEFRRDERRYPQFTAANQWIESNVGKLKRRAKRQ